MYDFGLILKQLREKQGYTQSQLAEKINRSKTVICKYESNTLSPSFETVRELANIFNVSLDYLGGLEKNECISLKGFTDTQIEILKQTADIFSKRKKTTSTDLTPKQNELLGKILSEFIAQNSSR